MEPDGRTRRIDVAPRQMCFHWLDCDRIIDGLSDCVYYAYASERSDELTIYFL